MDPSSFSRAANDWLKQFAVTLKNVSLYSVDHPRAKETLDASRRGLEALFEDRPSLALTCAEGRISMENLPVERDRAVSDKLGRELSARGVKSLEFAAGFRPEEYQALIRALLLKPEKLADRGGLEAVLLDEGVSSISVNRARAGKITDAMDLLTDLSIMDLFSGGRGRGASPGGPGRAGEGDLSTGALMADQPVSLAEALCEAAARKDRTPAPGNPDFRADQVAAALERLARRAIQEGQRPRAEILGDLARIVASAPPPIQVRLMAPRGGHRPGREALTAAVQSMSPESIAEIVNRQQSEAEIEYGRLHDALAQTSRWREDRQGTMEAIESRLASRGISPPEAKEIMDHLVWAELDLDRRVHLLSLRDNLWRVDFQRVREVLVKLFGADRLKEATALVQKYLSGLLEEDPAQRRRVAENARHILHLIERTGKGTSMLSRMRELFLARLQDETDIEVQSRLAAALGYVADLHLRIGKTSEVLALMLRADEMAASPAAAVKQRGERLREALARAGNEKLFQELTDRLLGGDGARELEAAAILKHAGSRAADHLIERLAEEKDRRNRAELVRLLKEMNQSGSAPFIGRLKDPRWYLVRNVVHILGELGDPGVVPALAEVADHEDPRVRKELVKTAVKLGGSEAERMVMTATGDADRAVQLAAVKALASLHGGESESLALRLAVHTGALGGSDTEIRREAIIALGRRRVKGAEEPLAEILRRKALIGYAEPTELRLAAAQALGSLGGERALEALTLASRDDGKREVREAARAALGLDRVGATD